MPRIVVSGTSPNMIIGSSPVLPARVIKGEITPTFGTFAYLDTEQVVGLLPLSICDTKECREVCDEYINPVFGELKGKSFQMQMTYENDWSSFLIKVPFFGKNPPTIHFELEKFVNGKWKPKQVELNSNAHGKIFNLGSITGHPSYAGYSINWGSILFYKGAGCYRFKAITRYTTIVKTFGVGGIQATCTFNLTGITCAAGKIEGTLKTTSIPINSKGIAATYTINQTNTAFTIAQNVAYIVNLINTGIHPYTATQSSNSFTITGQKFSANNNVNFLLNILKPSTSSLSGGGTAGCNYSDNKIMLGGKNGITVTKTTVVEKCLVSPPFDLKKWDCQRAHGTVKFETWLTGIIGDPYRDYFKHNICGIQWYDSIRVGGFFGYQKSAEYKTENLEWGAPQQGKIEHIRDEQIQRWEYLSKYLPEYIHTRFSTFAMMCDKTFASDYNINNSDYTLKRKNVIKDSGYEPEYIDKDAHPNKRAKAKVQVFFKRGVQSVEKSICC